MSATATILTVISTIAVWVAIFFGLRWLIRRIRADQAALANVHDPVHRDGFSFEFARLTKPVSNKGNQVMEFVEYSVHLHQLAKLSLADADAIHRRTTDLFPLAKELRDTSPIDTVDDVFDGHFSFVGTTHDSQAHWLDDADVRSLLLDLRDGYEGLWIDHGTLRVVVAGRPQTDDELEINLELLLAKAVQLRDRIVALDSP